MIHLKKLKEVDFSIFKSWINSSEELFQFAGPIFKFPITDMQLLSYITDNRREVYKVIRTDSNEIIGNAELNFENKLPRLSRILIGDPAHRNKGIGKMIVTTMLHELFHVRGFESVDLNVFEWNTQAIRCYGKNGFEINPAISYKQEHNGSVWIAVNMTISKKQWSEYNSL